MKHDQYKTDMMDAVTAVYKARGLTTLGAGGLRASILAPRDPDRMKDDTIFRTNGKCGASTLERAVGLSEAFDRLNCGRDGG